MNRRWMRVKAKMIAKRMNASALPSPKLKSRNPFV
jgi:hypothetical protein